MATQYAIHIAPNKSTPLCAEFGKVFQYSFDLKYWGGPYITMMPFVNKNSKQIRVRKLCQNIIPVLKGQKWKPSDFNLKIINGCTFIEIKSETLDTISRIIESHGFSARTSFRVILGRSNEIINLDFYGITKYLESMDWYLTLAKKKDDHMIWIKQWSLNEFGNTVASSR